MKRLIPLALLPVLLLPGAAAQTTDFVLPDAYVQMLRSDLRAKKKQMIVEALGLTDAQGEKFWPVHREYENELARLTDMRVKNIKEFLAAWNDLTDAKAKAIGERALAFQEQRVLLQKKYFALISKAVSPSVAARFFQIEWQILNALDMQLSSELPMIK
jgi:Spy/CpxP family protein refolding chaperone